MKHQRSWSKLFAMQALARPRKPNSIQNAFVLTNFLSGVLNSQPNYKLRGLQYAEYLFVAGFHFREEFLLLH
jgi:hypothetical protein